jgi:putative addiction module killer protein
MLKSGNPGEYRNLKGGVSEAKIDYGPGYRIYFAEKDGKYVIILCGGDKSDQNQDIKQACKYWSTMRGEKWRNFVRALTRGLLRI